MRRLVDETKLSMHKAAIKYTAQVLRRNEAAMKHNCWSPNNYFPKKG